MSNDLNRPSPDLRTTPLSPPLPWAQWVGYLGGYYPSRIGMELLASYQPDGCNGSAGPDHHDAATGNSDAACDGPCSAMRESPPAMAGFTLRFTGSLDVSERHHDILEMIDIQPPPVGQTDPDRYSWC